MVERQRADKIINQHILWAIGAGLMPIPLLDIAAVGGIQLDMLRQLAALYGVSYSETDAKAWLTALSGSLLAKIAANAIKLIPGIGTILGGISMSALSGASTYALGQVAVAHFEAEGDLSDLDFTAAKRAYDEQFEKGKQVASTIERDQGGGKEVFDKLERLKQLRDKDVISADDFEAMKKKLLDLL